MARRKKQDESWKWSDLTYEMRVMAWWFRNQPATTSQSHPWGWFIGAVMASLTFMCSLVALMGWRSW